MNAPHQSSRQDEALAWLNAERERESRLRRIGYWAWAVTFGALLIYAIRVAVDIVFVMSRLDGGIVSFRSLTLLFDTLEPLITVIGTTALLIAVLSTIGTFVRLRTATMAEVQMRLAALEQVLTRDQD